IQPRVYRFISILRYQYGQFWLNQLEPWDSRNMTLGAYCTSQFHLMWTRDSDPTARYHFHPTPSGATIRMQPPPGRGYEEFLTENDWRSLQEHRCLEDVGLGTQLLGHATEALRLGNLAQAFVNTISALEIGLASRLRTDSGYKRLAAALNSFDDHETL